MPFIRGAVLDNTTGALNRAWHAVATSDEVAAGPTQVWLLGRPWAVARTESGALAAWLDRCPHRLAPLSAGRVVGERIQCGYHGWVFDTEGRCICVPAIDQAPPGRAAVEVPWGLEERFGLVWMAPEEAVCPQPAFPDWENPAFATGRAAAVRTHAGAALIVDNLLDTAHFAFLHSGATERPDSPRVTDDGVRRSGWTVESVFETAHREEGALRRRLITKTGHASLCVRIRVQVPDAGTVVSVLVCCTPERQGSTRVYRLVAHNDPSGDPGRIKELLAEQDLVLQEDLALLEQFDHDCVPLTRTAEVHTKADRLSLAWRSVMAELAGHRSLSASGT